MGMVLTALDLSWNGALGPVMSREGFSFGCLERTLAELSISSTSSSRVMRAIGKCEKLSRLDASWNADLWEDTDDTLDLVCLRSGLRELVATDTRLPPAVLHGILEFEQLEALEISYNATACQSLGSNGVGLSGARNTLIKFNARNTGLTGEGLRWILNTFKGLASTDFRDNGAITLVDLMGLDFGPLKYRLVELGVSADPGALADLQKKLPLSMIHTTGRSRIDGAV